jgi:branched-subunit amino acid aminotransferase/4-amino-4-deoxychorismate lyase
MLKKNIQEQHPVVLVLAKMLVIMLPVCTQQQWQEKQVTTKYYGQMRLNTNTLQEVGTMNVFFIIGNKAVTPSLEDSTILAGVTRDSAITILKKMGLEIDERKITIDELIELINLVHLKEVFGTGTAATISLIKELKYKDYM